MWKPNTLAFTTTYGSDDDSRVFKVEFAEKQRHPIRGQFFYVEGKVSIALIPNTFDYEFQVDL